jgi:eukaryotic-like serine/threonine-protein kinase
MHLGNYELVRKLGHGGMADVYLARQSDLDRYVAIKLLDPDRVGDPDARTLFLDEARLGTLLSHQNVAIVYEIGADGDATYIAMEHIDGANLRELMCMARRRRRAIPYGAAVAIVRGAAAGLGHAHERCGDDGEPLELVHRDVSLSNIMVTRDGAVKVIDFGIASARVSVNVPSPHLIRGKPGYMAPEQCLGHAVDARADVFALGVVLYELAVGRHCFDAPDDYETMLATVNGAFVAPRTAIASFPRDLERVILTALARDPNDRYASAAELADALSRVAIARCDSAELARLMAELGDTEAADEAPTRGVRHRQLRAA